MATPLYIYIYIYIYNAFIYIYVCVCVCVFPCLLLFFCTHCGPQSGKRAWISWLSRVSWLPIRAGHGGEVGHRYWPRCTATLMSELCIDVGLQMIFWRRGTGEGFAYATPWTQDLRVDLWRRET